MTPLVSMHHNKPKLHKEKMIVFYNQPEPFYSRELCLNSFGRSSSDGRLSYKSFAF